MADKAYITPKVLQWARESARMSLETAAAKVSIAPEKLANGKMTAPDNPPSSRQKYWQRHTKDLLLFFSARSAKRLYAFAGFSQKTAKPLGTASVFIIREIQQKQAWIRDVFENNNESVLPFVGRFSIHDNPAKVANDILDTLQINKNNYSVYGPINEWIDKAESRGIFISKTSFIHTRLKLDSEEMQGFAIADSYAPFIFINSEDWNTSQFFTLVHELAHIWIAESGISNEIEPELKHKGNLHPIELFCNEVAANALMPIEEIKNLDSAVFNSLNEVSKISKKLGVSSFAFLFRALKLQIISIDKYRKLKILADSAYKAFLQREDEKKAKQKKTRRWPEPLLAAIK